MRQWVAYLHIFEDSDSKEDGRTIKKIKENKNINDIPIFDAVPK